MKTRRVLLLVVALLAAAPVGAAPGADDTCEVLGGLAASLAQLRDEGRSQEAVQGAAVLLVGDSPDAALVVSALADAVYKNRTLDGEVLRLITIKACRKGQEGRS